MTMTARAPVPDEGELRLGSVRLPAGRLLRLDDDTDELVAWITETAVPEPGPLWSALHGQTGLVPILAPAGRGDDLEVSCYDPADVADVDRVDAAAIIEYLCRGALRILRRARRPPVRAGHRRGHRQRPRLVFLVD